MKKFEYIFFTLILIAFILKFFLIPGGALLSVLATFTLSLIYLIRIVWKRHDEFDSSLVGITATTWILFVISRIQYWPAMLFLFLAILSSAVFVIRISKYKPEIGFRLYILMFFFTVSVMLLVVRASSVHYFMTLSQPFHTESYETGYPNWDLQSWFLYSEGQYDEAVWANSMAISAIEKDAEFYDLDSLAYKKLNENLIKIKDRNWDSYSHIEYYGRY